MEATGATRTTRRPRVARIGLANALLLIVAILMVLATAHQVSGQYRDRQRLMRGDHAFSAWVAANGGGAYGSKSLARAVSGLDVICANRIAAGRHAYRQCLLAARSGPYSKRVVGGYRRPPGARDDARYRYSCFGRAIELGQCAPG